MHELADVTIQVCEDVALDKKVKGSYGAFTTAGIKCKLTTRAVHENGSDFDFDLFTIGGGSAGVRATRSSAGFGESTFGTPGSLTALHKRLLLCHICMPKFRKASDSRSVCRIYFFWFGSIRRKGGPVRAAARSDFQQ